LRVSFYLNVLFSASQNSDANIYLFFLSPKKDKRFAQKLRYYFLPGRSRPVIFLMSFNLFSASRGVSSLMSKFLISSRICFRTGSSS